MTTTEKSIWRVGVDGGGTRTRLIVMHPNGNIVSRGEGGSCNLRLGAKQCWHSIQNALRDAFSKLGLSFESHVLHGVMGLAGTENKAVLNDFLNHPHPFSSVHVISDAEAACRGAHAGQDGAVIIVGTGAVGFQRIHGDLHRVSGYGLFYDDQGSGAWIGWQACQWVLKKHDGRLMHESRLYSMMLEKHGGFDAFLQWMYSAQPSDFAEWVPQIVALQYEDEMACSILKSAAVHLEMIHRALREKQMQHGVNLSCAWMGGAKDAIFPYLSDFVRESATIPKESPEEGVLRRVS